MKPLIVSCSNWAMLPIMEISLAKNQSLGYDVQVYDINGEMGYGKRFNTDHDFSPSLERIKGKLPFKATIILDALQSRQRFLTYMDCDAFAIRSFDEIDTEDYDIGVTMRRPHERGRTEWPVLYGYCNTGVVFAYPTKATFDFLARWQERSNTCFARSDQQALNELALEVTDFTEYDKVFEKDGLRIKVFKCDDYNFYYWPETPLPTTKIVHCKTDKRAAMFEWARQEWT